MSPVEFSATVIVTDLRDPAISMGWTVGGSGSSLKHRPAHTPSTFTGKGGSPQEALQSLTEALEKELSKHTGRASRVAAALDEAREKYAQ